MERANTRSTTKDTKYHEGFAAIDFLLCTLVSFVVNEFILRVLRGERICLRCIIRLAHRSEP